ncbi:MAG: CDP-alcohol phosphatidyltransferase family protein [Actinomycetes bacterium]
MADHAPDEVSHKILTIPNILSMLRLLLIPVFVWLALGPEADGWAFFILAVSSITDWLDGVVARRFHMVSRAGQLLDPIADRLFVISTILVLAIRGIVPWWLVVVLVLRDVFMGLIQLWVNRRGVEPLPVHYVGKAATLCLLYGMPVLFLTTGNGTLSDIATPLAWAFIVWGTGIYWWSAVLYAEQASAVLQGRRLDVSA